jgi:hypothetical protein
VSDAGKKAIADAAGKLDAALFVAAAKPESVIGGAPNVNEVTSWLAGLQSSLPDVLINDSRDKTKYKLPLPKQ